MRKLAMILSLLVPAQLWADDFDYYVLSLSWSASFCDIEGDAKQSDQCEVQHDYKWILHGLWPQYDQGWPAYCNTSAPPITQDDPRYDRYYGQQWACLASVEKAWVL